MHPAILALIVLIIVIIAWGVWGHNANLTPELLYSPVKNPANPEKMEYKGYWLHGELSAFYVGKSLVGRHMFRVKGITNPNNPDDTIDLTSEEVVRHISTTNEAKA